MDHFCSHYTLTREDDARLHTFLVEADAREIKWLYYLPYNRRREELYLAYYRYQVRGVQWLLHLPDNKVVLFRIPILESYKRGYLIRSSKIRYS